MANIRSQIKRIKITQAQTLRNRAERSKLKTYIKKFLADIAAADKTAATTSFKDAVKVIDTAARKGIIHKNNAAGRKSRLALKLNALTAAPEASAEAATVAAKPKKAAPAKKAAPKKPAAKKPAKTAETASADAGADAPADAPAE